MNDQPDNLAGVLAVVYKWRKAIRNVCFLVLAVSVGLSLMMDNYYQATTVFYPASPELSNPENLFGNTGIAPQYFGRDADLDRLAEIAGGQELADYLISKFNLHQVYGMDSTTQKGRSKMREIFGSIYSAQKNKNDALEISVEDTDRQRAADMANAARLKVEEIAHRLNQQSEAKLMAAHDENIKLKQQILAQLTDSLYKVQTRYGIFDPEAQGEALAGQLVLAEADAAKYRARLDVLQGNPNIPRDTIAYLQAYLSGAERQVRMFSSGQASGKNGIQPSLSLNRYHEGITQVYILRDLHFQARKQLSYDLERYHHIRAVYNSSIPLIHVIETAEPPLEKSRPKRSVIVIGAVLAAAFFMVLAALMAEAYKGFDWAAIRRSA